MPPEQKSGCVAALCHVQSGRSAEQARLDHLRSHKTTKESGVYSKYNSKSLESFKRDSAQPGQCSSVV